MLLNSLIWAKKNLKSPVTGSRTYIFSSFLTLMYMCICMQYKERCKKLKKKSKWKNEKRKKKNTFVEAISDKRFPFSSSGKVNTIFSPWASVRNRRFYRIGNKVIAINWATLYVIATTTSCFNNYDSILQLVQNRHS